MNKRSWIYLVGIVAAAATMAALQPWAAVAMFTRSEWIGVFALVVLGVLAELRTVRFSIGDSAPHASLSFVPQFAMAMLFPPPAAILGTVITYCVTQFPIHRKPFPRAAFNVAQVTLSIGLAVMVFRSLGGTHGTAIRDLPVLSFVGLAVTYFFANQLFVSIILALVQGGRVGLTFARISSGAGANLAYDLLVSPIAYVVVVLYAELQIWGLVLIVLPLILIRHSYLSKQKLVQANKDILQVLVKTIETRDPYTSGHSLRVAQLAKAIAEDLDLSPAKVDDIHTAAVVHDIGKIDTVFADLIRKESSLTDNERRIIVTHAAKGAEFLRTLSTFPEHIVLGVQHHHERFDGSGYPDGLSGDDIPLAARIIMLCDSIDAMLSDRPYRRALPVEQVRAELIRCSGSQFDPKIVNTILQKDTLLRAEKLVGPTARKTPLSVAV